MKSFLSLIISAALFIPVQAKGKNKQKSLIPLFAVEYGYFDQNLMLKKILLKNEISTFLGYHIIDGGEAYQVRYDLSISKGFCTGFGLRHQYYNYETTYSSGSPKLKDSKIIMKVLNSKTLDLSVFLLPVNSEKFRLKLGGGFDFGYSHHQEARNGYSNQPFYPNDLGFLHYWQYDIYRTFDIGYHFILQLNYYISNHLFISGQVLYSEGLKSFEINPEENSVNRYSNTFFNTSLGIGFRF